ncbi:hypothetical protein E0K89_013350 [Aquicoccus sp. SCR17]|nr:hypothetical protein [Carideicomes alvinocaridis]
MKTWMILALGLPVMGLGAGYGLGMQLAEPAQAGAPAPAKPEAERLIDAAAARAVPVHEAEDVGATETESHPAAHVVRLGSIMVPVYKPRSVSYVVADFGVAMPSQDIAARYRLAENSARLRDAILTSFQQAAANPRMHRAGLDSDWLSAKLTSDLRASFGDTQEVLFLSLYKQDVPRS